MEFLYEYGLFLAKIATLVLAIALVVGLIAGAAVAKNRPKKGQLQFTDLTKRYQLMIEDLQQQMLSKKQLKQWYKAQRVAKNEPKASKLYVIEFNGSMDARETESLREEITAILAIATKQDEVLLRLESGGGVVHGYGLAASQLDRLRKHEVKLTIAIDKIAASGGYMMACIGNTILSAPFAIVGSIGVIAQLPNFNKLLKKNNVDFEQFTAGEFKRTVTVFGENTDKGRQKFQQELEDTHYLFKQFVQQHRPKLDIDAVATGEHWFGHQALDLNLVDSIQTSDDYIVSQMTEKQVFGVRYQLRKGIAEKVGMGTASVMSHWWQKLAQHYWIR
ncbi:protease SohB [Rheinheimera sp. D18]|uniref:protease SohB n=1 Tax=Rheinheimera sp. D18 TaxID=2545632 RepID=UPI00104901D0|nr:protease SohB [Rheinheimera sp. D18]QBL08895.1 protease SohB [Rheinheimera sp. D18]